MSKDPSILREHLYVLRCWNDAESSTVLHLSSKLIYTGISLIPIRLYRMSPMHELSNSIENGCKSIACQWSPPPPCDCNLYWCTCPQYVSRQYCTVVTMKSERGLRLASIAFVGLNPVAIKLDEASSLLSLPNYVLQFGGSCGSSHCLHGSPLLPVCCCVISSRNCWKIGSGFKDMSLILSSRPTNSLICSSGGDPSSCVQISLLEENNFWVASSIADLL